MNRSRITGDLVSQDNIFVDIANDRVGIGTTQPTHKIDVKGNIKLHDQTGHNNHITYKSSGPAPHIHLPTGPLSNLARTPYIGFGDRGDASGDFKIYHDHYNAHLKLNANFGGGYGAGLGGLFLSNHSTSGVIGIQGANGSGASQNSIFIPAGATAGVKIYQAGQLRFETVGYGVTVHGTTETQELNVTGVTTTTGIVEIRGDGSSAEGMLQLNCSQNSHGIKLKSPPHSAGQSYTLTFPSSIVNNGFLKTDSSGNLSFATVNTDLSNDTSPQLGGTLDLNGNQINGGDSNGTSTNIIMLGASNDLKLYHNGSHSFIDDTGTGNLKLRSNNFRVSNVDESKVSATFVPAGAVELYNNHSKKFETTSSGIDVTGTVTADNQIVLNSGDSTPARIDLYCEVSNAHYTRLQAPAHSTYSGNVTVTIPNTSGNLAVLANAADNRIVTATGTHAMTGESGLTWTGSVFQLTSSGGNQFPFNVRNDFTPNSQRADYAYFANSTSNNALRLGSINSNGGVTIQSTRMNDSAQKHNLLLNPDGGDILVGTTDSTVYNNGDSASEGIVLRNGEVIDIARKGDLQLTLNRQTNDGPHIAFYRSGAAKSYISTRTNDFCIDVNGTNERLRIHSDGKISTGGITNPSGIFCIDTGTGTTIGNTLELRRDGSNDYHGITLTTGTTPDWSFGQNSLNAFEVYENGAASTTRLTILNGGNTGIGLRNPTEKLHVSGNIKATGISATGSLTSGSASTIGGDLTVNGYVLSQGTANRGAILGQLSVGYSNIYLTVQPVSGQTQLHFNFNNGDEVHIGHSSGSTLTVNGAIKPKTDSAHDLGLTGTRWRNVYADTLYGDGSNITNVNATTLDNIDSGSFLRSDATDTATGQITFDGGSGVTAGPIITGSNVAGPKLSIHATGSGGKHWMWISNSTSNTDGAGYMQLWNSTDSFSPVTFGYNASTETNFRTGIEIVGNLKLGTANISSPSTGYKRISINNNLVLNAANSAGGFTGFQNNAYINSSGSWVRINNDHASSIGMDDGVFYIRNAGAGTGTISWLTPVKIQANNRINIGEGNSGSALAAVHINSSGTMGTDTALWVGDNSQNRYMAIFQNANSEQFSHMELRYNDNGSRSMLQLSNPYAPAGYGAAILWRGYNNGTQAYIETKSEGANSANASMYIYTSGNKGLRIRHSGTVQAQEALVSRNGIVQINQVTSTTRYAGSVNNVDLVTGSTFIPKTNSPRFLIMIFLPVNTSDDSDAANQNTNPYYYGRIQFRKNGGSWTNCDNLGSTSNQGGSSAHVEMSPNRTGDSTTDYWSGNRYRMEHKVATVLVTNVGDCGDGGNVQFKLKGYAQHQDYIQIGQPHGFGTDDNYPVQPWGFTVFELAPDSNSYTPY